MDNRTSSPPLKEAFAAGVLSTGARRGGHRRQPHAAPLLRHRALAARRRRHHDRAATIPVSDNGVKMVHAGAAPLTEDEIQGLLATIEGGDFERGEGRAEPPRPARGILRGRSRRASGSRGRSGSWSTRATASRAASPPSSCAASAARSSSSTASPTAPFPITSPIPEMEENMRDLVARVVEVGADVGIAYDGDADRVGVDRRARAAPRGGSASWRLLARDLLTRHPGAEIVFDVKCSQVLIDDVRAHGGRPVMWKTGHSHPQAQDARGRHPAGRRGVRAHVLRRELVRGGRRAPAPRAGSSSSCRRVPEPASAHFDTLPHLHATPELKAPCPDDKKFAGGGGRSRASFGSATRRSTSTGPASSSRRAGASCAHRTRTPTSPCGSRAAPPAAVDEMKRMVYTALRRYPFVTLPAGVMAVADGRHRLTTRLTRRGAA